MCPGQQAASAPRCRKVHQSSVHLTLDLQQHRRHLRKSARQVSHCDSCSHTSKRCGCSAQTFGVAPGSDSVGLDAEAYEQKPPALHRTTSSACQLAGSARQLHFRKHADAGHPVTICTIHSDSTLRRPCHMHTCHRTTAAHRLQEENHVQSCAACDNAS